MFCERLKYLRKNHGLTQAEFANQSGLSRSAVGMYEAGKREPDFETLELIADFFNVDIGYLIDKNRSILSPVDQIKTTHGIFPQGHNHFTEDWMGIPLGGQIAAGPAINSPAAPDDEIVYIPPDIAYGHRPEDFFPVIAEGDSMYPVILDGDRLVFARCNEPCGSRRVHAISFGEEMAYTAKLVRREEDGTLIISAYNSVVWEPKIYTPAQAAEANLKIHGVLVYKYTKF